MKWTYEVCAAAALMFSTKRDFREKSNCEFQWLRRNGLLDRACGHMISVYRILDDKDIAEIAKKYATRRAFKLGDQSAYKASLKRGIADRVCAHMDGERYRLLSDSQIAEIAERFSSRSEFVINDSGAYQTAIKRGILDAVCSHMPKGTRRLSDAELLTIAGRYKTRNDFKLGDFGAYTTSIRRGLIDAASEHMEYGATGFREDKPAVLYQFRVLTPDGLVLYKVGITNRKPKQRLITMGLVKGSKATLAHSIPFENGRDARIAEKRLHRRFSSHRYVGPPVMKNGNTELFTVNVLDF